MASRWLQVSATRAELYVDANPLRYGRRKHTKERIDTVRHLDFDFAIDGEAHLTWLRSSEAAKLIAFILTSAGKYQVLCRVDGSTLEQQESALKLLAITSGGDPACTHGDQVLRLPGFFNSKYDPACPVTVKYPCDSTSNPGHFRLDIAAENALLCPVQFHRESVPKGTRIPTTSSRDLGKNLPTEKGAEKDVPTLALRRTDIPSSLLLHRPASRCRNRPLFVPSTLSRRMTLSRYLKFAIPSRFPPHFAPFVHTKLRSRYRGIAWQKILSSPHLQGDNANT